MKKIYFFAEEVTFTLPTPAATAAWIQAIIQQECCVLGYLNFIFCSDHYLHAYNLQYLQHNTLTDVLAFDHADTPGIIEGDIYISVDRVRANAQTWQQPFMKELHIVMAHGVLHLLGYRDHTPADKALMRQKEAEYMAQSQYLFAVTDTSAAKAAHKKICRNSDETVQK